MIPNDRKKTYIDSIFETSCGYDMWQTLATLGITQSHVVIKAVTYEHTRSGDAFTMIEKDVFFFINREYEFDDWDLSP